MPAVKQMTVRYVGTAPLPKIVMGPATRQHYLINPGKTTLTIDERDATLFLTYTGDVRFERG